MNRLLTRTTALCLLAAVSSYAQAEDINHIHYAIEASHHIGDTTLIETGDELSFGDANGVMFSLIGRQDGLPWETEVGLGVRYNKVDTDPGVENEFYTVPLMITVGYRLRGLKLALGMSYHIDAEYEFTSGTDDGTIDFDQSAGFLAEISYYLGQNLLAGLRYEDVSFDAEDGTAFFILPDGSTENDLDGTNASAFIKLVF